MWFGTYIETTNLKPSNEGGKSTLLVRRKICQLFSFDVKSLGTLVLDDERTG